MNWLWPQSRNPETSMLVRAGRFFHWFFLIGVLWFPFAFWQMARDAPASDHGAITVTALLGSFCSALFGRGIRYILSNE